MTGSAVKVEEPITIVPFLDHFYCMFFSKLQNVYVEMVVHSLCLRNRFVMPSVHIERTDCSALCKELTCLAFFRYRDGGLFNGKTVTLKGIVGVFAVFPEHPDSFISSEITDGTIVTLNTILLQNDVC